MISSLFYLFLYQPIVNFLVFIYEVMPANDFGLAIIALTLVVRIILYPLSAKSIRSQKALTSLQPEVRAIQEKYKNDQETQMKEILAVYQRANINPFSGFVPILVQLPILLALYKVLWDFQEINISEILYSFMSFPGEISPFFLGTIDLAMSGVIGENGDTVFLFGNMLIIVGASLAQYFQMKMIVAKNIQSKKKEKNSKKKSNPTMEMAEKMQKQMVFIFPFFTFFILFKLPLAIGLYWLVSTCFSIVQQHFILKKYDEQ